MNEWLFVVWIIINKEGIVLLVYCFGCKVGLVEICLYIVSILFYIEVLMRINEMLVCM